MTQMKNNHTVSVIIPAYNIEKYIARAINSVLKQTLRPDEIIVVDDGSSDGTSEIIKSFGTQVRYLYQKNGGLSAARNTGIKAANYEWIAFLDGDDEWLEDKLRLQTKLLHKAANLVWASTDAYCQNPTEKKHVNPPETMDQLLQNKDYFDNALFAFSNGFIGNCDTMMVKRRIFEKTGLFNENLKYAEDVDMWWRIGYRWPEIGYVNKPLAIYHIGREGSLTASTSSRKILSTMSDIFTEHLELSAQYGKQDDIRPFVIKRLQKWLTINYRRKEFGIVRDILRRHKNLFPAGYYHTLLTLASLPTFTVRGGRKLLELLNDDASV